nr:TIGR01459 family HAD-type hydrolase [Sphingomonas sp. ACRSK]
MIAGLRDVASDHDAFLVDQFGVLHDGTAPYPGAVDTLLALRDAGKLVIVLSNSGKRAAQNATRLERLGFPSDAWTQVLTSGEVAWSILAEAPQSRRRCLLLARDGDRSAIGGLPIDLADGGGDCDVVLIAASEGDRWSLADYEVLLAPAAARRVPAYCTNPDRHMLTPVGLRFGAGQVAELYERLGGMVSWIGKPYPEIYAAARRLLGDVAPARILCVGDSVEHDVAGAAGAGLASCLVRSGIHVDADDTALAALYDATGATPQFLAPAFRW